MSVCMIQTATVN